MITASRRNLAALACVVALATAHATHPAPAFAGEPSSADRETARTLMQSGDDAFDAKDYAKALDQYRAAHALVALPSTGIWVAKTLEKLGRLTDAREAALEVTRLPKKPGERDVVVAARGEADALAQSLAARIPTLEVVVVGAPAGATYDLTVDGALVKKELLSIARKVDPGNHKAEVKLAGFKTGVGQIDVKDGAAAKLTITLEKETAGGPVSSTTGPTAGGTATSAPLDGPAPPTPPAESGGGVHPLVWVGVSVTGAGLLAGAIGGGVSYASASSAKDLCGEDNFCPADAQSDIDTSKTTAWVSNIGFGVAGAGAVLLVVGLLLPSDSTVTASVSACGGPGGSVGPCLRF